MRTHVSKASTAGLMFTFHFSRLEDNMNIHINEAISGFKQVHNFLRIKFCLPKDYW